MPLALNPTPVVVTPEIVTLEFPLLVNAMLEEPLAPTFTFPKLTLVAFAPRRKVGETPVPIREMVSGEPGALLTNEIEPVALPADVGVNNALNVAVLPGTIVRGATSPVILNSAPDTLT
jgi:hypothetical protein